MAVTMAVASLVLQLVWEASCFAWSGEIVKPDEINDTAAIAAIVADAAFISSKGVRSLATRRDILGLRDIQ